MVKPYFWRGGAAAPAPAPSPRGGDAPPLRGDQGGDPLWPSGNRWNDSPCPERPPQQWGYKPRPKWHFAAHPSSSLMGCAAPSSNGGQLRSVPAAWRQPTLARSTLPLDGTPHPSSNDPAFPFLGPHPSPPFPVAAFTTTLLLLLRQSESNLTFHAQPEIKTSLTDPP